MFGGFLAMCCRILLLGAPLWAWALGSSWAVLSGPGKEEGPCVILQHLIGLSVSLVEWTDLGDLENQDEWTNLVDG